MRKRGSNIAVCVFCDPTLGADAQRAASTLPEPTPAQTMVPITVPVAVPAPELIPTAPTPVASLSKLPRSEVPTDFQKVILK